MLCWWPEGPCRTDRKFDSAWGGGVVPGVRGLWGGSGLATHVGPPECPFPPVARHCWPISRSHAGSPWTVHGPHGCRITPDPGLFKTEIENVPLGFTAPKAVQAGQFPYGSDPNPVHPLGTGVCRHIIRDSHLFTAFSFVISASSVAPTACRSMACACGYPMSSDVGSR